MKRYRVICDGCEGQRLIEIHPSALGERIDWLDDKQPSSFTIISGRKRLDGAFGWQCVCGQNDLMTTQEANTFSNPAAPTPQEISQIVDGLIPDQPKFRMVEA